METFTVQAIYKKGVLKPKIKLDLPENTIVEVEVRSLVPQKNLLSVLSLASGSI